ncbi:MAG: phenylalanine--tRNA ligase subunit beta [Bacteroidales bacterium]|nr:phenylalanine--tRNA ligase subunit beta [Bacteroidales bacterium]
MKISYNWLKDYVDIPFKPSELGEILTNTGLEVEGIEEFESVKGGLKDVVIGKVLSCKKHPNAHKLSIAVVDIGDEEPVQIVCGAPNVASGQTVPVAKEGATLFPADSTEGFQIKKAKIRGELSTGMICAEDELGLGNKHDGIMVLDDNALAGSPASDYFNIEKDTVFEIGLTPNRIDAASHIGTARDIMAYLKHDGQNAELRIPPIDSFKQDNNSLPVEVSVENPEACPRYSGITLTSLKVRKSPEWLQNRLKSIGLVPINNIVDITNFILHEAGQPLHAFDADKISGNKVIVRTMPENTDFVTLDEKERTLTSNDLMICNAKEGMCIAGVFGGIDSGVTENTTRIFLESACFDPVFIRRTAKHHQLNTDASFRFERGTDPNLTVYALKRAALMMKELAGAKVSSGIIDIYPEPVPDTSVEISFKNVTRLIGKTIKEETIESILESLGIEIKERFEGGLSLLVPPYRVDVTREADVIEEILRIYGYNNIEFNERLNSTLSYIEKPDPEKVVNTVSDLLSSNGFREIKSNSLTREAYFDEKDSSVVKILNALSQDLSRMRKSLLPGGLEALIYNINRKRNDLKFYEFGNCYFHDPGKKTDNPLNSYSEEFHLGIFLTGSYTLKNWTSVDEEVSYYHLKAITEMVFSKLGIDLSNSDIREVTNESYDQALEYSVNKSHLVTLGRVSKKMVQLFDIKQDVYAAEINWDTALKLHKKNRVTFTPLPKFPEVKRDLSLMLDTGIRYEQLRNLAFLTEKKILRKMDLFDIYDGEKIEKGKKSYAISFVLMDEEKTLTDKQIDKAMMRISKAFEKELGAVVRGA